MLTTEATLGLVEKLVAFPRPQVCKHYAALLVLTALEAAGFTDPLFKDLVKQVVESDDEAAALTLQQMRQGQTIAPR